MKTHSIFMPEDLKEKILKFLMDNKDREFNIKQLSEELGISYPTALKWVEVLSAEGKINVIDWGNLKVVRYKG